MCIVELHIAVNNIKISSLCTKKKRSYGQFLFAGNNQKCVGLHVERPVFFVSILAKFGVSEQLFMKVTWYQVSRKSVQ